MGCREENLHPLLSPVTTLLQLMLDFSWNVMVHGDAREGKWRGNWRMEWVASTLHTTSEHGVSSITTADAHTSAASGRLNWRPHRFKWTRPFRPKTKSGFCACAITFRTLSAKFNFGPICLMNKWIPTRSLNTNAISFSRLPYSQEVSGRTSLSYTMYYNYFSL